MFNGCCPSNDCWGADDHVESKKRCVVVQGVKQTVQARRLTPLYDNCAPPEVQLSFISLGSKCTKSMSESVLQFSSLSSGAVTIFGPRLSEHVLSRAL